MGDWIWVLITAMITFLGLSFINVTATHEATQLYLDFPDPSLQSEQNSIISSSSPSSIDSTPSTTSAAGGSFSPSKVRQDAKATGNVGNSLPNRAAMSPSTSAHIPWEMLIALGIILIGLRAFSLVRASESRIDHSASVGSA